MNTLSEPAHRGCSWSGSRTRTPLFLTSGNDNLALHRATEPPAEAGQRLDHLGFILNDPDEMERWHRHLADQGVRMLKAPKTHRDGARSFFCQDPDGISVQIIFHPPLADG